MRREDVERMEPTRPHVKLGLPAGIFGEIVAPGTVLFLTVLALNVVGDTLRDIDEPEDLAAAGIA